MIPFPSYHGDLDLSSRKILVTGGAGFIGSHLCDYFVTHGAGVVRIADDLSTGSLDNICHLLDRDNVQFRQGDVSDPAFAEEITEGMDYVLHQAALGSVPRSVEFPSATHNANVNGFFHLLEASRKAGVSKFIYASSSSVYGDNTSFPRPEEALGNLLSPYAVSKRVNELYGMVYHRVYGMYTTGLRYFNIFGPRQNPEGQYAAAIPRFILRMSKGEPARIFGNGNQTRDFTFVANAVQANVLALLSEKAGGEILNIGVGTEISLNDLVDALRRLIPGSPGPEYADPRKGDVEKSRSEISKAAKLLGYSPSTGFSEGLEQTVKWFTGKDGSALDLQK